MIHLAFFCLRFHLFEFHSGLLWFVSFLFSCKTCLPRTHSVLRSTSPRPRAGQCLLHTQDTSSPSLLAGWFVRPFQIVGQAIERSLPEFPILFYPTNRLLHWFGFQVQLMHAAIAFAADQARILQ